MQQLFKKKKEKKNEWVLAYGSYLNLRLFFYMYLSQIIHPGHFFTPQFCGFKHGLRFKVPQQKNPKTKTCK